MTLAGAAILVDGGKGFSGWSWGDAPMDVARVLYSFPAGVLIYRLHRRGFAAPVLPSLLIVLACLLGFLWSASIANEVAALAGFPLLVILGASAEPKVGWLRWVFAKLGLASYAVYALHYPVLNFAMAVQEKLRLASPPLVLAVLFVPAIIGVALAADKFWDNPIRAVLTRCAKRIG
jgi:peptidoglycan/LPS O-acetylase OafA/YrhL